MAFLGTVAAEASAWVSRGIAEASSLARILKALNAEHEELAAGLQALESPPLPTQPPAPPAASTGARRDVLLARLIAPVEPQPPSVAPAAPAAPAGTAPSAPRPAAAEAAEPAPPWYLREGNLRWLANLGILVFNVGLIGFITTSWGGWSPHTKVSVLVAYTVLLLSGGLLLRLGTRMSITGLALLVLAVISVPIEFYTAHYYQMTSLSGSALGLIGSATSLALALWLGVASREGLFFWIAYLADVALACFLLEFFDVRREAWAGPLLGLFGLYLLAEWFRRRLGIGPASRLGLLLAPARAVSIVGYSITMAAHILLWCATDRLSAAHDPATVIVPLALGCAYALAAAAIERAPAALAFAAVLKVLVLVAALRAADADAVAWPQWLMLLAVLMSAVTGALWNRADRRWLWPHHVVGWLLGAGSACCAAGFYLAANLDPHVFPGALDAFIKTLAVPLAAAALFAFFSRKALPAILAGLLALAETGLILARQEPRWHAVPLVFLAVAAAILGLGALARRLGRPAPGLALELISDLSALVGLLCLLGAVPGFWTRAEAPWAVGFLAGLAVLYAVGEFAGRPTARLALAGACAALVFGTRWAALDWPVIAAWLAAAGLAMPPLLERARRFARPALEIGHVAAAVGLVLAAFTYALYDDQSHWALTAIACAAALHVWTALKSSAPAHEYIGLVLGGAAYVLLFHEFELAAHRYCLVAAAVPLAYCGLSFLGRRSGWRAFVASSFDVSAAAALAAVLLALAFAMARENLWPAIGTAAILGALYLFLAFVAAPRKWLVPAASAFAGSALLAGAYLLVLRYYSTGTPYRSLWIFAAAPVFAALGLGLRRRETLRPQGNSAVAVAVLVSLLALWQALIFPDKPLVATLAFAVAAALYGVLAAMTESAVFGTMASAAFSVAYFSLLRHLHVPAHNYILWMVALAMLQALVGGAGEARARERRPALFVGLAVTVAVLSWMVMRGEVYFDRSGPALDSAIFTTLGAAAVFGLVAWLRRSAAALYPAAAAVLGCYYLVLHKFEVSSAEFYTVPVAVLVLLWGRLVVRPRWGRGAATVVAAAGLALLLLPSLGLSLDADELGHALAALGLAVAAVAAGMALRRKVYLLMGTLAFAAEAVIKLHHFVQRHHITQWIWLLLVGLVILGFVIYAETRRNKRLRAATDEAVRKVARMFEGWE